VGIESGKTNATASVSGTDVCNCTDRAYVRLKSTWA
jgi:hypothetical protein